MLVSFVIISKDEPSLDQTLDALASECSSTMSAPSEIVVVDASGGRLDWVRHRHPDVRWVDFAPRADVAVSIPHQRNVGVHTARGDVVVFTDCGCLPRPGWASTLVRPIISGEESVTVGRVVGRGDTNLYRRVETPNCGYLRECPTINVAFLRAAFEEVEGFDESFAYGSDIDFSWRLIDAGYRLRAVPDAVVTVNWGSPRRQLKRAWSYGRARARLYSKHAARARGAWRTDPVPFVYGLYVLGTPLVLIAPWYLALLLVPMLRNRDEHATLTILDHLVFGAGFVWEWFGLLNELPAR